jgi:hypothetical protein
VVELPAHIAGLAGVTVTTKVPTTDIVTVWVLVHPFASVPVTVYVVVVEGKAVVVSKVVLVKPVLLVHTYVVAPPAVKATDPLGQIAGLGGTTVMVGLGFTVTVTVWVLVQLLPSVPVTVYVVVVAGSAVVVS